MKPTTNTTTRIVRRSSSSSSTWFGFSSSSSSSTSSLHCKRWYHHDYYYPTRYVSYRVQYYVAQQQNQHHNQQQQFSDFWYRNTSRCHMMSSTTNNNNNNNNGDRSFISGLSYMKDGNENSDNNNNNKAKLPSFLTSTDNSNKNNTNTNNKSKSHNPIEIANELLDFADHVQTAAKEQAANATTTRTTKDQTKRIKKPSSTSSAYESPMQSFFDDMYCNGPTTLGTTEEMIRYEKEVQQQQMEQKMMKCGILETNLRFTTTSYGRTLDAPFVHNNEHRVICKLHVKDLPFTMTSPEYQILQQIVGIQRLNNHYLRLTSNHFGSRIENKRHLVSMMDRIISSCQRLGSDLSLTSSSTTTTTTVPSNNDNDNKIETDSLMDDLDAKHINGTTTTTDTDDVSTSSVDGTPPATTIATTTDTTTNDNTNDTDALMNDLDVVEHIHGTSTTTNTDVSLTSSADGITPATTTPTATDITTNDNKNDTDALMNDLDVVEHIHGTTTTTNTDVSLPSSVDGITPAATITTDTKTNDNKNETDSLMDDLDVVEHIHDGSTTTNTDVSTTSSADEITPTTTITTDTTDSTSTSATTTTSSI